MTSLLVKFVGPLALAALVATSLPGVASVPERDESQEISVESVQQSLQNVAEARNEDTFAVLENNVSEDISASSEEPIQTMVNETVVVPQSLNEPILIDSQGDSPIGLIRPNSGAVEQSQKLGNGATVDITSNDVGIVTAVKKDGSVQIATVIASSTAPTEYQYELQLPANAKINEHQGLIAILDDEDRFLGGVAPAWAVDAQGNDVPTRYTVKNNTITQTVDHKNLSADQYPITADPLFSKKMIKQVTRKVWNAKKGGWEMSLNVTLYARATWLQAPHWVYKYGLEDLKAHYPRQMAKATMDQQWACHVAGLPGTITIDLEGWRKSKPDWRKGITPALLKAQPAKVCNW